MLGLHELLQAGFASLPPSARIDLGNSRYIQAIDRSLRCIKTGVQQDCTKMASKASASMDGRSRPPLFSSPSPMRICCEMSRRCASEVKAAG